MKLRTILIIFFLLCGCNAHKILVVFPILGKSHSILGEGVVYNLLKAGHEVTYIQGYAMKTKHPNLTEILPKINTQYTRQGVDLGMVMSKELNFNDNSVLLSAMHGIASRVITDEVVQEFLKDQSQKFDLIIAEFMFSSVYSGLPAIYGCPFIWFCTTEPHWQVLRLMDGPFNPAYNTDILSFFVPPLSFYERFYQLKTQIAGLMQINHYTNLERELFQTSIVPHITSRGRTVPDYDALTFNASLMFGNSHVSLGSAPTLPQSYKNVGGYHINPNVKPLEGDLKKLLDNAKEGLIFFSLGSNLRSKDIPKVIKDQIMRVFSELKQTVLWKFEETLSDLPKNVHIVQWAPQPSILAHPNTVLFITHGGLLSTIEAIHFGKPIIGIPVFADQFVNVEKAVAKGFARKVDLGYSMENELRTEIKEMLGNPKYSHKVKEWSLIYHDRPVTPAKELIHWTEHVIKLGGAPHLRSLALMTPWYQKVYLDLAAVLLIFMMVVLIAFKRIWMILRGNKTEKKKKI